MNWSGGYKHRFRPNAEIRKTAFQQQSRIILVDLVKHDDLEQTGQISPKNRQKFTITPPKVEAVSNDDISLRHFGIGTPFHNIPCGSSSDSEGSGNDEISNTKYSPLSLDQDSTAELPEHHITSTSEEEQIKVPSSHKVDEHYEDSNPGEVLLPQKSSQSGFSSFLSNSSVECFTPPPYLNPSPYSSTPNLSFLTPVIHRENTVRRSTKDRRFCQQDWDNSNLHNLPHLTSLTDEPVIQENSIFKNQTQTDNREASSTKNCSMFVPVDVTPAQRKQVHFYSSDQESSAAEHGVKNFSEENQVNASTPAREQYDDSSVYAPRNKDTLVTSIAGCSTPRSYSVNQHFHYPTPTLGSATTATHQENLIEFSTKDQRIPGMKDSTLQNLPCSTSSINTDTKTTIAFETTPIRSNTNNHKNPAQVNWSMFPPLVVTPAQQRRVQFASSVPIQKMKVIVNNTVVPMEETSNLNTPIPRTSFTNGSSMDFLKYMSVSPPKEEHTVVITEGVVSEQHESCKKETICLVQSSSKIVTTYPVPSLIRPQDRTTNATENRINQANPKFTTRKRKQSVASWKTSVRKKFNGGCIHHCRCRTVIRKVKIRDAETQT